jgi:dienelactone hydrolase
MNPICLTPGQPCEFPIWAEGEIDAPDGGTPGEIAYLASGLKVIRNVSRPTLTAYLPAPAIASGTAVGVCPRGAHHFLAFEHEGVQVAEWLNRHGIAAFMLKYRLAQTGDDFPECVDVHLRDEAWKAAQMQTLMAQITADGGQAVHQVRAHAHEWGLSPRRVGIMGFSAGGTVTLNTALQHNEASRPDFAAPIYSAPGIPVPVPADAPPLFLLCAADDEMASDVSTHTYAEWRAAGKPVELHIYAQGGHGFGMNANGLPGDHWIERFAEWLRAQDLLSVAA